MNDDAISVYKTEITLTERHPWALASIGLVYLAEGNTNTAETFIDELFARAEEDFVQTSFLAVVRAGQGRVDEAFELLGQAYEERDALLFVLRGHRMFDQLRHDPRFDSFLEKMGFVT